MTASTAQPQTASYTARRDDAVAHRDSLARRARSISNLRLLAFLAGLGGLVWAEARPEHGAAALVVAAVAAVSFFVLIGIHSRLKQRERWAAEMAAVNQEGIDRIAREWDSLPSVAPAGPPRHGYAHDLDVFGHGSLARYFGTAGTALGKARLHEWLLAPAGVETARRRQESVRELVPLLDFRQELQVSGRLTEDPDPAALDAFLDWAEDDPWLLRRPWLVWLSRLLPLATLLLLVLYLEGSLARPWWILTLLAGTALAATAGKRIHRLMARASLGNANLHHFASLVGRVQDESFDAPLLRDIHAALTDECDARHQLERLSWVTELADLRHSGLFYVLVHVPTLWDFHVLWGLERWQSRAGRHAREWVQRVADIEALAALAAPVIEEDGWSFPELQASGDRFAARGLAHPLLPPASGSRTTWRSGRLARSSWSADRTCRGKARCCEPLG